MTNLDPKHLDALVERQRQIAILHRGIIESHKDTIRGPVSLSEAEQRELIADAVRAAEAITALRAQIDRERAATIEAAGLAVADTEIGYYDGISGDWRAYTGPVILSKACASIRALHADATRAAMDAIRQEQGPFA